MFELEVQKYLRETDDPSALNRVLELGLKFDEDEDLLLLNYHQIDSPKTHPIVMECRGLILEKGTWDVVAYPFKRFFNYGEAPDAYQEVIQDDIDAEFFKHALALEKLDGSLVQVFFYKGNWRVSTRGRIDATGHLPFSGGMTFQNLIFGVTAKYPDFWNQIRPDWGYVFELISPENRVVTTYDYQALCLLAIRERESLKELHYRKLLEVAENLGVMIPKTYPCSDIQQLKDEAKKLNALDEGFVCVDYRKQCDGINYYRIKVKNPPYLAIAHLKESSASSLRGLMQLVIIGEQAEFLSYFPEYKKYTDLLSEKYEAYIKQVENDWESIKYLAIDKSRECRKGFAMQAQTTTNPGYMFMLYKGEAKTVRECVQVQIDSRCLKLVGKKYLALLKVKDIEFEGLN